MRILIVEDEPEILSLMKEALEIQKFDVFASSSGNEGLDAFYQYKPDIVITDIQMPGMDGLELLKKIREASTDVIVIVITGHGSENYALKALDLKANNYLKKPFKPSELCNVIKKYELIIRERTLEREISSYFIRKNFLMQFGNDIGLVAIVADRLMLETGGKIHPKDRLGIHLGLVELIYNAIEHGNLAVTFDETTEIVSREGSTFNLLKLRLQNPELAARRVSVEFDMNTEFCQWIISDQGDGFDFTRLPVMGNENPLLLEHGRGIYLSKLQFDEFEYMGKGNIVRVRKYTRS